MTETNDLMIDLETMGTSPNGAIVAIGARYFDLSTGMPGQAYYMPVSLSSSVDAGMEMETGTVQWWMAQSAEARDAWMSPECVELRLALLGLMEFINACAGKKTEPWGNGASFDLSIIRRAYDLCGLKCPWHYSKERDVRTLVNLARRAGVDVKRGQVQRRGPAHHALADCDYQIEYCSLAWQVLMGSEA